MNTSEDKTYHRGGQNDSSVQNAVKNKKNKCKYYYNVILFMPVWGLKIEITKPQHIGVLSNFVDTYIVIKCYQFEIQKLERSKQ